MRKGRFAVLSIGGAVLIGLTTGCVSTAQNDPLTANALNVQMAVADPQLTSTGTGATFVDFKVTFFEDLAYSEPRAPSNAADDFSCDGKSFIHDGSLQFTYLGEVPALQAQGEQTCTYTHGGKATRFSFATPLRPVVTEPLPGARLSPGQNLTIVFTPSATAPTSISIDGKTVITLSQPVGEAIIPAEVVQQFLTSPPFDITISQTTLLTPVSGFNNLEIEYTSSTVVPVTTSS